MLLFFGFTFQANLLLVLFLESFSACFGRWKFLRHGAAQILNGLAYFGANFIMGLVSFLLTFNIFATQFFFCLRGAEQVGCQFRTAHMIKDLLALLQALFLVNAFGV